MPADAQKAMEAAMQSLTPEQRAKMEALQKQLKQRQDMPQVHSDRSCWTKAKMEKNGFFGKESANEACLNTITQNDSHKMVISMVCAGKETTGKGQLVFNATSPTTVTGTMDMTMMINGKAMTSHTDFHSNWIGPDCGDIK